MNQYFNAGQGLKKMFIAAIGAIICTVCLIIPLVNIIAAIGALVFAIISIVGLNQAGKDIEGCKTAFILTIVNLVVSVLKNLFAKAATIALIIGIAGDVLSFLVTFYVCTSVAAVMLSIGANDVAAKGETVWKITLVCDIILVVISILSVIPGLTLIAGISALVTTIVALIAQILYLIFINKSYHALGA